MPEVDTTALLDRIANGRTDLVWEHVARGGTASARSADGTSLLEWCAYFGDVSAVRFLVAHGESLRSLGEDLGLNGAAFHGHWRLCEFLIERGAGVDRAQPDTGETPLHAALCTPDRLAHDLVLRVLLAHGADPNRTTTPSVETGAFMRDCRTKGETPLHRAAAFGTEETLDLLLAAGADREARDAHGDTPLSWGSWYARPDAILRKLCYGRYRIRPDRQPMRAALLGTPRGPAGTETVAGGSERHRLLLVVPVLHVSRAVAAREFYCEMLGFREFFSSRGDAKPQDPCYLGVVRDGVPLHLSSHAGDGVGGAVVYIEVDAVDALHAELAAKGVTIDTGPIDQTWGTREMYVKDGDRNSIRFVQRRVA